jgi:hypothetical protein
VEGSLCHAGVARALGVATRQPMACLHWRISPRAVVSGQLPPQPSLWQPEQPRAGQEGPVQGGSEVSSPHGSAPPRGGSEARFRCILRNTRSRIPGPSA